MTTLETNENKPRRARELEALSGGMSGGSGTVSLAIELGTNHRPHRATSMYCGIPEHRHLSGSAVKEFDMRLLIDQDAV